ncbi:hypothetical protein ACHWQZ_G018016 [Mnemiopsis leidyi]
MIRWLLQITEDQAEAVNLFMTTLLITGFLVSTTLNPLIIAFHRSRDGDREKLSSRLFVLIAISDLLTNSYPALHILYFCLAPNIDLSIQVDYTKAVDPNFKHYSIPSLFLCAFGCLSQVSTAVLATVRMISIFKPMFSFPRKGPGYHAKNLPSMRTLRHVMNNFSVFGGVQDRRKGRRSSIKEVDVRKVTTPYGSSQLLSLRTASRKTELSRQKVSTILRKNILKKAYKAKIPMALTERQRKT